MDQSLLLISVGNTRTRFAVRREGAGDQIEPSLVGVNADQAALSSAILAAARGRDEESDEAAPSTLAFIASVNDPVADHIQAYLESSGLKVFRFGRDAPIPMPTSLTDPAAIGQDRLLDALGAFWRSQQACIVVDAGTAVTVDFVDGQGAFHGGAIAPGVGMMLASLHEQTSRLPLVRLTPDLLPGRAVRTTRTAAPAGANADTDPDAEVVPRADEAPFGTSTEQAIAVGVTSAVQGLVHVLVDRYAEFYGAYPRVVATGGDAPLLFENDPLIEAIVPDLTLIGMLAAISSMEEDEAAAEDEPNVSDEG